MGLRRVGLVWVRIFLRIAVVPNLSSESGAEIRKKAGAYESQTNKVSSTHSQKDARRSQKLGSCI